MPRKKEYTMSQLLYFAADTFDMNLHVTGSTVWGRATKDLELGPWLLETPVEVISNALEGGRVSFLTSITQRLWLFVVVGPENLMYVVDAVKAGLTLNNCHQYGGQTVLATLDTLGSKNAVTAVFKYVESSGWSKKDLSKYIAQPIEQ